MRARGHAGMWARAWFVHGCVQRRHVAASPPRGRRHLTSARSPRQYSRLFVVQHVATAVGRLGTIAVFASHGDVWDVGELRGLIRCGLVLELVAACSMLCFRQVGGGHVAVTRR